MITRSIPATAPSIIVSILSSGKKVAAATIASVVRSFGSPVLESVTGTPVGLILGKLISISRVVSLWTGSPSSIAAISTGYWSRVRTLGSAIIDS